MHRGPVLGGDCCQCSELQGYKLGCFWWLCVAGYPEVREFMGLDVLGSMDLFSCGWRDLPLLLLLDGCVGNGIPICSQHAVACLEGVNGR
mmetsp:Transcript_8121/g.15212  ORF Transcript_8121/g.15212 Transcript_8121/m.15212 type:complete len:90 (-) Transcript_8121:131-400(-)